MTERRMITVDGNEAVARVAHKINEVIAIYPITPASPMGELSDQYSVQGRPNLWGTVPDVVEMQSEAGAAAAVHGSLQAGSLTTTFTASQGLLLMIPNLYKIAGELSPAVIHVAARTLATHALSIFGDHSDVMACRQCGMGLLASGSVQEAHDFALISQEASLQSRIPFLHFFDGFRTSHEVSKIYELTDEDLRALISEDKILEHRERKLTPDAPVLRGTAQNPDVFFQAREAANLYYDRCPGLVAETMARFAKQTGREYHLFDYCGHPEAERVIVMMGSGAETAQETVEFLGAQGEKIGLIKVRLYRPFANDAFLATLPKSTRSIAVLDRCKEPGATGDPLHQDVIMTLAEAQMAGGLPLPQMPRVVGGRYGLSSKEFTPAMVKAIFEELAKPEPRNHFTVGIKDDVTHHSLDYDSDWDLEQEGTVQAIFFGLGSDGTVGANKNSIKIIGEETESWAQGYFVYDSKKSGAITVSHLRFGPKPIRSTYLVQNASFVACHQWNFIEKYDLLENVADGATLLLNSPHAPEELWDQLPKDLQSGILEKKLKLFTIDAYAVAKQTGMGVRINTIMQTCFFAISGVLPREEAIAKIKEAIKKSYGARGEEVVRRNYAAVDGTLAHLHQVDTSKFQVTATRSRPPIVSERAPDFIQNVTAMMMAGKGDLLPVSAFPVDGTWDTGTTKWEKRNIALAVPIWDPKVCIQCNQCAFVCPHAAIRAKVYEPEELEAAPDSFQSVDYKARDFRGSKYTIQVAPEDCTGCELCVQICPAKDKANPKHKAINMVPHAEVVEEEKVNFDFFLDLPQVSREKIGRMDSKGSQLLEPLFEFSGACAGCGETPYIKLLTQLFGDRLLIANATGCSSIYGGNLPTTPYTKNAEGRGPAWSNSLFEDNAEFGFGMRLAVDQQRKQALELVMQLGSRIGDGLADALLHQDQSTHQGVDEMRKHVAALKAKLGSPQGIEELLLRDLADSLVKKSVWIVGGDGWAYDIGYGGLDHVLGMGRNINVLVLDTEVYSNTGGQASKSTPIGAAAKFAMAGKSIAKKDLGQEAMAFGSVYVARIAFGSKYNQTVQAFQEAESYPGTSLIIAYSPCIAHGYDLKFGVNQSKLAVDSGIWPLYRYDPRRIAEHKAPLQLDYRAPKVPVFEYMKNETRFRMVEKGNPERFRMLKAKAQEEARKQYSIYEQLAQLRRDLPEDEDGKEKS
ncbi:MAG: pyruvate:ferredoxin (flavodoxin) oxidoreductase [Planctomycetota bacterium]|nr:MAG: pyruvate:ferredoxin (flavodoxin) oxidoreductase [Planctomycetota bacterium]